MAGEISWNILNTNRPLAGVVDSYAAGQAMGRKRRLDDAYRTYATDPARGIAEITAVDPKTGLALRADQRVQDKQASREKALTTYGTDQDAGRKAAFATGDVDLISAIAKMDETQRAAAKANAETFGSVATALKGVPLEQRKAALLKIKSDLVARGLPAEQIDAFEPTDEQLDLVAKQALTTKDLLDQEWKAKDFGLKSEDTRADNTRADKQLDETGRHNRVGEGISRQNAGTSAYGAQTGRMSYDARKAAGGFGTPGAFIDPKTVIWDPQ